MYLFLLIVIAVLLLYLHLKNSYRNTEYYRQTKNPYSALEHDKGRWGEYCIFKSLKSLKGHKKFLFNCYLPKPDGETTEADVILLHESGIYVFESKNYSGWIFGDESQEYWVQVLPAGRGESVKSRFFNPTLQNKVHLKWLRAFLENSSLPVYSYIVFGDSCTLKDIRLTTQNHVILHLWELFTSVRQNAAKNKKQLLPEEIDHLYETLYPLTQTKEEDKQAHRERISRLYQDPEACVFSHPSHPAAPDTALQPVTRTGICPRCGGRLVLRTAARGEWKGRQFLGCANYPACRYLEDISST